jgi:hypothetical protein
MGSQFLGLILLILAVAAGLYAATHYTDLLNLRIEVPVTLQPVSLPAIGGTDTGNGSSAVSLPVFGSASAVRISSVRLRNEFTPYSEVVLVANLARDERVNITGWTVKSNKGFFKIPRAQEVYSSGGTEGDIYLRSGDRVNLYSSQGPKGNFRLNKCMGYLADFNAFNPALPKSCPTIARSEVSAMSGRCQEYILSLRACEIPVANPPVPIDDSVCHAFLSALNYVGCVNQHRSDPNFLDSEWRVWIGGDLSIFDPLHDKVQLIDGEGRVVDEYVY